MASKSDTFQSWLIIKSPNIYIIKCSALFVAHAFQLRNTKCFTNRTRFIIVPLLGGLQHDCQYYISKAFLRAKKKKKVNFLSQMHVIFSLTISWETC